MSAPEIRYIMDLAKLDWGSASGHPDVKVFARFLGHLLTDHGPTTGPVSEFVREAEETTASYYADETNRVLRVQTESGGREMSFDIVVQLAAPTIRKAGPED
jgi:hypothetical protein